MYLIFLNLIALSNGINLDLFFLRYIEIFRSTAAEMKRSTNGNGRPGPYDLKDRGGNRPGGDYNGRNMRGGKLWCCFVLHKILNQIQKKKNADLTF